MYRFVVCIDVPAKDLPEAYRKMRRFLTDGNPENALGWETTDEWYKPDGEQGDDRELQAAIVDTLVKESIK